jgi:hypothetical protein
MRAMREARYRERSEGAATSSSPARRAVRATRPAAASAASPTAPTEATESPDALCGHRSMNGRTCTREHGHAAKSHRYS